MKLPFIILGLLFSSMTSFAQEEEDYIIIKPEKGETVITSEEAVQLLSKGTLIVRISKLEHQVESIRALQGEEKAYLEKERIDQACINLIKEFQKDYSFSDLVFAYDVQLYEYLQGSLQAVFINDNLKIDPDIKIKEGPIFILASHRNKIFELYDENFKLIEKPAPVYSTPHFNRKYQFFLAQAIQSLSDLFTKDINAAKFNKKLKSQLRK